MSKHIYIFIVDKAKTENPIRRMEYTMKHLKKKLRRNCKLCMEVKLRIREFQNFSNLRNKRNEIIPFKIMKGTINLWSANKNRSLLWVNNLS